MRQKTRRFALPRKQIGLETMFIGRSDRLQSRLDTTEQLIGLCGDFSKTNKMFVRLGKILVAQDRPTVWIPCCPDYTHRDGKYTFEGLNGGIPLLAKLHIDFMERVCQVVPVQPLFLLADLESHDPVIRKQVGKSLEEFTFLLNSSLHALQQAAQTKGWDAAFMSDAVNDLENHERSAQYEIEKEQILQDQLVEDTTARIKMYATLLRTLPSLLKVSELIPRTTKTAAQYVALGRCAARKGVIIANHSTTSLKWYMRSNVAVLHNPTSIY